MTEVKDTMSITKACVFLRSQILKIVLAQYLVLYPRITMNIEINSEITRKSERQSRNFLNFV